jgi:hypothetical protein
MPAVSPVPTVHEKVEYAEQRDQRVRQEAREVDPVLRYEKERGDG